MNDLQRQYLRAAHDLAIEDPMHTFNEDEIANHVDLDPKEPGYVERLISTAEYLKEMGFLAPFHKGSGMGRRALKITRAGIEEVERFTDPIVERKERRQRFLRTIYMLADGNPAEFVYWQNVAPEIGLDANNSEHLDQALAIADYLERSGLIAIEVDEGTIYRITAKGVDQVEGNKPEPQSVSNIFNISGSVHGSVIGTHNTTELTNNFDFRRIEAEIEEKGGEDKEELREALEEVRRLLESGEKLDRGGLAQFSSTLEKHSWFTGSVMQALLGFATQVGAQATLG